MTWPAAPQLPRAIWTCECTSLSSGPTSALCHRMNHWQLHRVGTETATEPNSQSPSFHHYNSRRRWNCHHFIIIKAFTELNQDHLLNTGYFVSWSCHHSSTWPEIHIRSSLPQHLYKLKSQSFYHNCDITSWNQYIYVTSKEAEAATVTESKNKTHTGHHVNYQ